MNIVREELCQNGQEAAAVETLQIEVPLPG